MTGAMSALPSFRAIASPTRRIAILVFAARHVGTVLLGAAREHERGGLAGLDGVADLQIRELLDPDAVACRDRPRERRRALMRLSSRRFALLWRLLRPATAPPLGWLRGRASRRRLLGRERDSQKWNRCQDGELSASHRILQTLTVPSRARVRGACRWAPRL